MAPLAAAAKAVTAQVMAAPKQVELRAAVKAAAAKAEADRVLLRQAEAALKSVSGRLDRLKAVLTLARK